MIESEYESAAKDFIEGLDTGFTPDWLDVKGGFLVGADFAHKTILKRLSDVSNVSQYMGETLLTKEPVESLPRHVDTETAEIDRLRCALEHYAKGAQVIGFDRGEVAQEALRGRNG